MTEVLDRPDAPAVAVASADGDARVVDPRSGRFDYKWIALGVVLLGTIMTILDATIVNIAIPTLQVDLKAGSYADIAWVVTGYMLAQGAALRRRPPGALPGGFARAGPRARGPRGGKATA